ncbi:MAG: type II toxin-antitoxin system VapC family toxin [Candidatus Bipolaricaulia bacterium]
MAEALFSDVNIPMYAAGRDHPYRESCRWVMTEITEGRIQAAIDTEIIQELLYRYGALRRPQTGVKIANQLLTIVPTIYPVTPEDVRLAVELFVRYAPQGVQARDLIHVAVMQNNGFSQIISTDTHFDQIQGIRRLDPKALFASPRAEE